MKFLIALILTLSLTSLAFAESWPDKLDSFLKTQQLKSGQYYNLPDSEFITIYGSAVKKDILIENFDLDILTDGDKGIMVGLDYAVTSKDTFNIGIGFLVGLDRFENMDNPGELTYGPMFLGKLKF